MDTIYIIIFVILIISIIFGQISKNKDYKNIEIQNKERMKNFESIYDLILDREKSILKIEKEAINELKKNNEIKGVDYRNSGFNNDEINEILKNI